MCEEDLKDIRTHLHRMVISNCLREVEEAILNGADLNFQDCEGKTPLHYAAENDDRYEIAKTLLKSGADINLTSNSYQTALMYACKFSSKNIVNLLLSYQECLINCGVYSALHIACRKGNLEIIHSLIDAGANINYVTIRGIDYLPIEYACNIKVTRILLEAGADIFIQENYTLLHDACYSGNREHFDLFIEYFHLFEKVLNLESRYGTPLKMAAQKPNFHFIKTLIDYGADVGKTDRNGYLPLEYVISAYSLTRSDSDNFLKSFKLLLERTPTHVIQKCFTKDRSLPCLLLDRCFLDGLSHLLTFGVSRDVLLFPKRFDGKFYSLLSFVLDLARRKVLTDSVIDDLNVKKYLNLLCKQKELFDPHYNPEVFPRVVSPLEAAIEMHESSHKNCICSKVLTHILKIGANPDYNHQKNGTPEAFRAALMKPNFHAIKILLNYSSHYPEDVMIFMVRMWVPNVLDCTWSDYFSFPIFELYSLNQFCWREFDIILRLGPIHKLIYSRNLLSLKRISRIQVWKQMIKETESNIQFLEHLQFLDLPKSLIKFLNCLD